MTKADNIKRYYINKAKQKHINKCLKLKRIKENYEDEFSPMYSSIRSRIKITLKKNGLEFKNTYESIIGCNRSFLKDYIFNKLKDGMNVHNYGKWEIDHIIPVSYFKFKEYTDVFKCFHYSNLQPLWEPDNKKKSNKILPEAECLLESLEIFNERS